MTIVVALGVAGLVLGRRRATASAGEDIRYLHSLPHLYGLHITVSAVLRALAVLVLWLIVQPILIETGSPPCSPTTQAPRLRRARW